MTPEQQAEVEAFAAVEPLGERREDFRAAMLAIVAARAAGAKGVKLADFLDDLDPDARRKANEEMSPEEMDRAMAGVE